MNQALQQISSPIASQIAAFQEAYQDALQSNNALLEQMVAHVNQSLGKQMRPLLVLLCAQLCGGITASSIHAAVSVELLHVASLIHDDVVDESDQRRGRPSLWASFQSKAAVLGGDFYLSAALSEAVKSNQLAVVEGIANMGKRLVDGELLQLSGSKNAIYSQAYYFKVIEAKTAELFKTCAYLGALSAANSSPLLVEKAVQMGLAIGICFQLKDDVFDYQNDAHIGKPVGNDIQEGKMTLPLLYVYEQASQSEKATIKRAFDNKDVDYIGQLVHQKGGIRYTLEQIDHYKQKALQYLQDFEESPTRKVLEQFILLVAERDK